MATTEIGAGLITILVAEISFLIEAQVLPEAIKVGLVMEFRPGRQSAAWWRFPRNQGSQL
jgi:hypothetical protein